MNRFLLLFVLFSGLAISSCKNDAKSPATDEVDVSGIEAKPLFPDDGGPADLTAIKAYVDSIDGIFPTMGMRGPRTILFGEQVAEAKAYSGEDDAPRLIYCQLRDVEQWYYLYNRRIVEYRERRPGKKGFEEQRWYYNNFGVIKGEMRNASNPAEIDNAPGKEIPLKKMGTDFAFEEVSMRIFEVLYGGAPR